MNSLTSVEHTELIRCEAVIERGLQTFVEVGNALLAIRDARLYRQNFGTFEEYCRRKWNMSNRHAHRLISAATVVENVTNWSQIEPPINEAQVRPLTNLEPEQQREAWALAIETAPTDKGGQPRITAAHVQKAADEIIQHPTETKANHVMAVMGSSESPEWYTPQHIIELTLELFDSVIDTDPCSNNKTSPAVPATFLYTKEDDGLTQTWHGAVYMNPPYGTEIPKWIDALVSKYEDGEIREAIALLPGRTDTRWFQPLYAYMICMVRGRLQFQNSPHSAPFPSVVVYLGNNRANFINIFKKLGPIMERIDE